MDDHAQFCPKCGQANARPTMQTPQDNIMTKNLSAKQGCGIFLALILFMCLSVVMCGDDKPSEKNSTSNNSKPLTAEEQLTKRKEACFSAWDGSHVRIKRWLQNNYLNDPSSYEHLETRFSKVVSGDTLIVITSFTAKNAFGGRVKGFVHYKTIIPSINNTSVNLGDSKWCPIFDFQTE